MVLALHVLAEDAVDAIDDALPHRSDPAVELAQNHGVAHAADDDRLVADHLRALELDRVGQLAEAAAAHPHAALVDRLVGRLVGLQRAARLVEQERVGVLVERVRRDADRRALHLRIRRLDDEFVLAHGAEHAVGREAVGHRCRAALENLGGVPRQPRREAVLDRQRGENRGVARAAGEHHLRAVVERFLKGLDAHHAHYVVGARQRLLVERRRGVERPDAAFTEFLQQVFAWRLGIDHRRLEMVAVLACDLLHDLPGPLEVDLPPCPAAAADEERNLLLQCRRDQQSQVALARLAGEHRLASAELVGAVVGRAAVAADEERIGGHHPLQRRFLETRADHAGGRYVTHFFHDGVSTRLEWESSAAEKPGGTSTVVSNSWMTTGPFSVPLKSRVTILAACQSRPT